MKRLLLIIGLFIGALLVFSLYRLKIVEKMRTKEVVPTIVENRRIQSKLILPAKIQYERIISVYSQEDGKIFILKKDGVVKKGEVLAYIKIDSLTELQRKEELSEANVRIEETKMSMEKALKEKEEAKYFFEGGVISKREFEASCDKYEKTKKAYQGALSKLKLLEVRYSQDKARVISPIEGIIYGVLVENESLVSKNTPVLKIACLKEYRIEAKLSEFDIRKCAKAERILLRSELDPDKVYEAKLKNISIFPDERGQFTIEIELLDKTKDLDLRTPYIAEFFGKPSESVLAVPISCIFKDDKDMDIVYLIKNNRIKIQRVQTGLSDEEFIEIKEGLSCGDEIVMVAYKQLNENDKVIRLQRWK